MNSDHVQRYHIRQDGFKTIEPNGEWVKYEDVKHLIKRWARYEDIEHLMGR